MTYSPLVTETHATSQQSARTSGPVNMIILHHAATTDADQVVNMMVSGSRQVSAHAVVKDNRIIGVVDESQRAWSLADAYWDSRAFTVETANESTAGWTISAKSHESLAKLSADWAKRYGFKIVRDPSIPRTQWTLLGHREVYEIYGDSYATACPGGMNLDYIANRANAILSGDAEPEPLELEFEMSFLPFCVQNKEPGAAPTPGLAIFSNGHVEAINLDQWNAYKFAGAKMYETSIPGHFAFFNDQAARLRASGGVAK